MFSQSRPRVFMVPFLSASNVFLNQLHLLQRWHVLVREPRAEHGFVPRAEVTANWPRDQQGHLTANAVLDPARRRAAAHKPWAPSARAAPAPPLPSHRQRLRNRRRQPSYLTLLLRKPRKSLPGSPGALTEGAVLLSSAGTRPRRLRSSKKPRTGTVMAADSRFPDRGSTSPGSSPRGWRPGSALTRPGGAASSAASQVPTDTQSGVKSSSQGRGRNWRGAGSAGGGARTQAPGQLRMWRLAMWPGDSAPHPEHTQLAFP